MRVPERRAVVRRPYEDPASWRRAVAALRPFESTRGGGSGIGGGGPQPPATLRHARLFDGTRTHGRLDVLRSALDPLLACGERTGLLHLLIELDARGRGRVLFASDTAAETGSCTRRVLEALQYGRGARGRRIVATVAFRGATPAQAPSASRTRVARVEGGGGFLLDDLARPVEQALARCVAPDLTTRVRARVRVTVGALGRLEQASASTGDAARDRCVERALAPLAMTCPEGRRPMTYEVRACVLEAAQTL